MDFDDEILLAFKKAREKGRSEISAESLLLMTNVPKQTLYKKIKTMSKFGMIKPVLPAKTAERRSYFKLIEEW